MTKMKTFEDADRAPMAKTEDPTNDVAPTLRWPFECEATVIADRFLIHREAGDPAISRSFHVTDRVLERPCILTVLHPAFMRKPQARSLFDNGVEVAQLAGIWIHSGTIDLLAEQNGDTVRLHGVPYYVMDANGCSLSELIQTHGGLLPWRLVIAIGARAARNLEKLHAARVLHRNLKPSSFFVRPQDSGAPPDIDLIDFEFAGRVGDKPIPRASVKYCAPELLRNTPPVGEDPAADVYSLGAVIYEVAARRPPFNAESIETLAHECLYMQPAPLSKFRPEAPAELVSMVARCLSKIPTERPTAKMVADFFESALNRL